MSAAPSASTSIEALDDSTASAGSGGACAHVVGPGVTGAEEGGGDVACTTDSGAGGCVGGSVGGDDSATGGAVVDAAVDVAVDDEGVVEVVDVVEAGSGVDTSGLAS